MRMRGDRQPAENGARGWRRSSRHLPHRGGTRCPHSPAQFPPGHARRHFPESDGKLNGRLPPNLHVILGPADTGMVAKPGFISLLPAKVVPVEVPDGPVRTVLFLPAG